MSASTPLTDAEVAALLLGHARQAARRAKAWVAAIEARERELEAEGWRLVSGGQGRGEGEWSITDYRTGQTLASGVGGYDEYLAATERLDQEQIAAGRRGICDYDVLDDPVIEDAYPPLPPAPEGIPKGLADAVAEWADGGADVGDPEVLSFLGIDRD
jgi:hypothetical protein